MASNNNPNPGPKFDEKLLACVQKVVELQARNRSGSLVTDPNYLAELELARNNISSLLSDIQTQNQQPGPEENGNVATNDDYQSLWESGNATSTFKSQEDEDDLYENTGPGSALAARAAQIAALRSVPDCEDSPPPLPPRAPVRGPAAGSGKSKFSSTSVSGEKSFGSIFGTKSFGSTSGAKSFSSTPTASSRSASVASLRPPSAGHQTTTGQTTAASLSSSSSTTSLTPAVNVATTRLSSEERIHQLKIERERLLKLLLDESSLKDRFYAELEILTQQIRRIPFPSAESYSLDNEAERQKLELRAQRVQLEMEQQLGTSAQCLRRQEERFQAVRRVEQEIETLSGIEPRAMTEHETQVTSRRVLGSNPGPGRQHHVPRSANLEQLYHQSLPMDKALSHSGPPVFGNSHLHQDDTSSVISFTSSIHSLNDASMSTHRRREDIDTKIEFGNSLMELFGSNDADKMSRTFLAMSSSPANCDNMRSSRIIPVLIQLLHGEGSQLNESGLASRPSREVRLRVARALHNIVHAHPNDKQCKREARVLRLLETLRLYSDFLRDFILASSSGQVEAPEASCCPICIRLVPGGHKSSGKDILFCETRRRSSPSGSLGRRGSSRHAQQQESFSGSDDGEGQQSDQFSLPCNHFVNYSSDGILGTDTDGLVDSEQIIPLNIEETMAVLTRCSFDEYLRQPIFLLGGIRAIAELIQVEREAHGCHGSLSSHEFESPSCQNRNPCTEVRRYAVVALTNLTFGNAAIKSFLCSFTGFIPIMVGQLESPFETLRKATAHLFRNLAWKADKNSKMILSESNVVAVLMGAAMQVWTRSGCETGSKEEPTLKVVLSALWNLSAHCRKNKADICVMDGALSFLVSLLRYRAPSIVENGGGILRNISSFIATSPDGDKFRSILRENSCLEILLHQLKSPSLTIVSNACGTLWNLSARCHQDQRALWDLGAVPMLQSLTNSKHSTISTCSLGALKNLYSARPGMSQVGSSPEDVGGLPSLQARKLKNLARDLDEKLLSETFDQADEDESSEGDSDSNDGQSNDPINGLSVNGADAAPASRVMSRCDSRDSLLSAHSDMAMLKHGHPAYQQQQQQRGGSLDRGQVLDEHQDPHKSSRHRRPLPLPLATRHQASFLRSRPLSNEEESRRASADNQQPQQQQQHQYQHATGYSFESHFGNFPNFQTNGPQQATLVNNYVFPAENPFHGDNAFSSDAAFSSSDNAFSSDIAFNGSSFNNASVLNDSNLASDSDIPTFGTNNEANDADDDLDEKPTDYSLRFQESEEPEYLSAAPPMASTSQTSQSHVENNVSNVDIEDDDDDICVDVVKSYCTEATPFDTPGPISEANSVNDLRAASDEAEHLQEDEDDEDDLYENRNSGGDRPKLYCTEDTPGIFSRADSLSSLESETQNDYRRHLAANAEAEAEEEKGQLEAKLGGEKEEASLTPPLPRRHLSAEASHHKTVTFNPQETPLIFSRHSSFESLNSFDQHSIRTGYSSCDFSRMTSGRVSPSDLPDSPGQSRPYSPHKQQLPQQKRAIPVNQSAAGAHAQGFLSANQRAAFVPTSTAPHSTAVVGSHTRNELSLASDSKTSKTSQSEHDEDEGAVVRTYKEEGTPAIFSSRTSLSGLTLTDDEDDKIDSKEKIKNNKLNTSTLNGTVASSSETAASNGIQQQQKHQQHEHGKDEDSDSDSCDEMLAKIQALGMAEKKRSQDSRMSREKAQARSTGIPVRSSAARANLFPTPASGSEVASPKINNRIVNENAAVRDNVTTSGNVASSTVEIESSSSDDEVLEKCVKLAWGPSGDENKQRFLSRPSRLGRRTEGEGVPTTSSIAKSTPTSSSRLPATSHHHGHGIACSTTSQPGQVTSHKVVPPVAKQRTSPAIPPLPPKRQGSHLSTNTGAFGLTGTPQPTSSASSITGTQDQVKVYALEGTPHNFSTATSLSDLTVDEVLNSGRVSVDSQDGLIQHHQTFQPQASTHRIGVTGSHQTGNNFVSASGHETPCHYATEGTPGFFSRNDSLSSLNTDDESPPRRDQYPQAANRLSKTPRSNLPRPQALGRSGSSASSRSGATNRNKSPASIVSNEPLLPSPQHNSEPPTPKAPAESHPDSDSSEEDERLDNLLASCFTAGIPKSRSEPLDLKSKSLSKLRRDKTSPTTSNPRERSKSKSPRNSRIIPGVRIAGLKLVSRSEQQQQQQLHAVQHSSLANTNGATAETLLTSPLAVNELGEEEIKPVEPEIKPVETEIVPFEPEVKPVESKLDETESRVEDVVLVEDLETDLENLKIFEDEETTVMETLTESRVLELEANRVVETVVEHQKQQQQQQQQNHYRLMLAKRALIGSDDNSNSMTSSVCSTISSIQPPSVMENLVSMSSSPEKTAKAATQKMECRHTLSGKKGHIVPEMVRRALGVTNNLNATSFEDMSSSLSSCQSNLDNIRPPTIMDDLDLDNSILSIASISSEFADGDAKMGSSAESANAESRCINLNEVSVAEMTEINDILPPSSLDEVSGVLTSKTLVADAPDPGATYTVEPAGNALCDADQSTYQDLTDVFDDSVEPTLTLGSDYVDDLPDLPRDSRQTTPAQSRENSRESTPQTRRKIGAAAGLTSTASLLEREQEMDRLRNFKAAIPNLDESLSSDQTSGYKSSDLLNQSPRVETTSATPLDESPKSSRQRRKDDADRFKTHTIRRDDLVSGSSCESSPRSLPNNLESSSAESSPGRSPRSGKQRRADEPDRFKTHTIRSADIRGESNNKAKNESEQFDAILEANAQLVVDAISEGKGRSRSASVDMLSSREEDMSRSTKARSASIEILDDSILALNFDAGSCNSTLERKRLAKCVGSPKIVGPRICKPGDSPQHQQENEAEVRAVRGRRKPLYSSNSSPKRSTVPPAVPPKPIIAPKPRKFISTPAATTAALASVSPGKMGSPPTQIRGTRASSLRQVSSSAIPSRVSPPSPKLYHPRSAVSSTGSTSSSSSSRSTGQRAPSVSRSAPTGRPPIVRQGTFTKDEPAMFGNTPTCSDSDASSVISARTPPRPGQIRRDAVHPAPTITTTRSPSISSQSSRGTVRPTQTRTSALRERSRSRQPSAAASPANGQTSAVDLQRNPSSGSNSSHTSSNRSVLTGMKPSRSIQSFKSAEFAPPVTTPPRRAPSSSDIDYKRRSPLQNQQHSTPIIGASRPPIHPVPTTQISDTQSENSKTSGKKEVTSRIASLWKRVEDSKKKVPKEKDTAKVWISKGKVIPENERALIKPDEKQRELINKFQANQKAAKQEHTANQKATKHEQAASQKAVSKSELTSEPPSAGLKPRSKSRLSIRLSKFSLTSTSSSKKDLHKSQTNPTTPTASSTPLTSKLLSNGDNINGNWATPIASQQKDFYETEPARRDRFEIDPTRRNCFESEPRSEESSESMSTGTDTENDVTKTKRMSRLGTFLNPTAEEEEKSANHSLEDNLLALKAVNRASNRSPSAIVAPFNYNPPADVDSMGNNEMASLKRPLKGAATSKIALAVRRNDSYVNSLGRLRDAAKESADVSRDLMCDDHETSNTSSAVITLV